MSVSSVSSSGFVNQNSANLQSRQQRVEQEFQALARQLQSGDLSAATTAATIAVPTALPQDGLPATANSASTSSSANIQSDTHHSHVHFHHHRRINISGDSEGTPTTSPFGQLGQGLQSGNSSDAQQAYSTLQQDLQRVALNSDLITAQAGVSQASGLSLAT